MSADASVQNLPAPIETTPATTRALDQRTAPARGPDDDAQEVPLARRSGHRLEGVRHEVEHHLVEAHRVADHGARHVVALDVGHGQLHPSVAADPRVSDVEGVSVRDLDSLSLDPFDILVADLSFISLTVAMPAMARAVTPEGEVVLLVKPQFEVGRERLGKNGIVSRSRDRALAIGRVVDCAAEHGLGVQGLLPSPISGTHGNREFLLWLHPADGSDMDPSVLTRTIEVVSSAPR